MSYDQTYRLQLKKIEKEQEEVAAEIRKTHQTRIDNSNVYVGGVYVLHTYAHIHAHAHAQCFYCFIIVVLSLVLPHITKKPRVKPLPNDMEYIRELVARKHKKWKKREEITMVQLVATISESGIYLFTCLLLKDSENALHVLKELVILTCIWLRLIENLPLHYLIILY